MGQRAHAALATRWLAIAASAASVALSFWSCVDLPSDRLWASEHFRYHTRSTDTDACEDILTALEDHGEVVHAALGLEWDEEEVVDYYKFDGLDDFNANAGCGTGAGCTDVRGVRSPVGFAAHELVHAYLAKVGTPPWLLIEGAAVAISCQLAFYPRPTVGWREAFEADRHSSELYGAGGWLLSRLLASRDPALFLQLYGTVPNDASADELATAFEDIYGEPLDEVWKETVDADGGTVFCPWECSRRAIELDGSAVSLEAACGVGFSARSFALDEDADVIWSGSGLVTLDVRSCERVESLGGWVTTGGSAPAFTAFVPLVAGRHFLVYSAPAPGQTLTVAGQASDEPLLTADCASAALAAVDESSASVYVRFPPSSEGASIRLSMSADRSMSWTPPAVEGQSTVELCAACDSTPGSCTPLPSEMSVVTLGPESVLTAGAGPGVLASFGEP